MIYCVVLGKFSKFEWLTTALDSQHRMGEYTDSILCESEWPIQSALFMLGINNYAKYWA